MKDVWNGGMLLKLPFGTFFFWKIFKRARNHNFGSMQWYAKCHSVFYDFLISGDKCQLSDFEIGPHGTGST